MVFEVNSTLTIDSTIDVVDEKDDIISLMDFVVAKINSTKPNYIIGDSLTVNGDKLSFSQRYELDVEPVSRTIETRSMDGTVTITTDDRPTRQQIIDFITLLKPWCVSGLVNIHVCHHDEGKPCEAVTELMQWGDRSIPL